MGISYLEIEKKINNAVENLRKELLSSKEAEEETKLPREENQQLLEEVASLKTTIAALLAENSELKTRVERLEKSTQKISRTTQGGNPLSWAEVTNKSSSEGRKVQEGLLKMVKEANSDVDRRKSNIIVHGIEESKCEEAEAKRKEEEVTLKASFNTININFDIVKRHYRVGKIQQDRPRPIILVLNDAEKRNSILQAAKKLQKQDVIPPKRIYFNPDLDKQDRDKLKELRAERNRLNDERGSDDKVKHYFGIRKDRVVKLRVTH